MEAIRIIGCGNLLRGDDAAGVLVIHRLRDIGIPAEEATGEVLRLFEQWQPDETVYLVDAAAADAPPRTILRFSPEELPRHKGEFRFSTHGVSITEVVGLAGIVGKMPRELVVIGIVGENFRTGARMTPAVRDAVEVVAAELAGIARSRNGTA